MSTFASNAEFYEWFFANADFGPAHGDVVQIMVENFEAETGQLVSNEIAYWR